MLTFNEKLQIVLKYPEMIEAIADVLQYGIDKGYPDEGWLQPDGKTMSVKDNLASKTRHAAKHFCGEFYDLDSGLLHEAHEGTRALMSVVRTKRLIIHPEDGSLTPELDQNLTEEAIDDAAKILSTSSDMEHLYSKYPRGG